MGQKSGKTPSISFLAIAELKEVWQDEAAFSDWLITALDELGQALGLGLVNAERERSIGRFSADIVCKSDPDGADVVIENQFTIGNHDHLGKMLTYAGGIHPQDSNTAHIIWIAPRFRQEHVDAMHWLNSRTDNNTHFYAVEPVVSRLADSGYAADFKVVAKPNIQKKQRRQGKKTPNLTEKQERMSRFWNAVRDEVETRGLALMPGNTGHGSWLHFATGSQALTRIISRILVTAGHKFLQAQVGIYGQAAYRSQSELWRELMEARKTEIEEALGFSCELNLGKAEHLEVMMVNTYDGDFVFEDETKWPTYIEWGLQRMIVIDEVFRPIIARFEQDHPITP